MTSILDDHKARNPGTWRDIFRRYRPPTALELATSALEECRREQLNQSQQAEYHAAMAVMLVQREKRLAADIERLASLPAAAQKDVP